MSAYEILSIATSLFAIIISIVSVIQSFRTTNTAKSAIETSLRSLIEQQRSVMLAVTYEMNQVSHSTIRGKELSTKNIKSAVESWYNAYYEACGKYIDKKIDKKRFRKQYADEIKNLVERDKIDAFNPITSKYKAIIAVYNEWYNYEK